MVVFISACVHSLKKTFYLVSVLSSKVGKHRFPACKAGQLIQFTPV